MFNFEEVVRRKQQEIPNITRKTIDVYAGLNVMALIFKIQEHIRYNPAIWNNFPQDDRNFYPCDNLERSNQDESTCLLPIFAYSQSIKPPSLVQPPDHFQDDILSNDISYSLSPFEEVVAPFLSSAQLQNIHLSFIGLRNANLKGANLSQTVLMHSDLSRAILEESILTSAKLRRANLREAKLTKSNLEKANLDSADLNAAKLTGANLHQASLNRAYLIYADLSDANLSNTYSKRAIFDRANLTGANFEQANLYYANFRRANLQRANLTQAELYGANFVNAIVAEANFTNIGWDNNINWYGAKGLHLIAQENVPRDLWQYPVFEQARELSQAIGNFATNSQNSDNYQNLLNQYIQILGEDSLGNPINPEICNSVSRRLKAALWNKFCWLCTLFGSAGQQEVIQAANRILNLMEQMQGEDSDYIDTVGVNFLMRGNFREASQMLERVIEIEDRAKNWAFELIQRRKDWLVDSTTGQNPFETRPLWLEKLRQEEYPLSS